MSRVRSPFGARPRGSGVGEPWWNSSPRPCGSGNAASRSPTLARSAEISQALGDEMHDFALALDAAAHGEHAG